MADGEKKQQGMLVVALIIILGFAAGYGYYAFFAKQRDSKFSAYSDDAKDAIYKLKNINLDFGIFDIINFKTTKTFGESPVSPGQPGKANLFAPF